MTWIAASQQERREQIGRFLLGAGGNRRHRGCDRTWTGPVRQRGPGSHRRAVEEGLSARHRRHVHGREQRAGRGTWNRTHPDAGIFIQTKTGITPDGPDLSPDRVAGSWNTASPSSAG